MEVTSSFLIVSFFDLILREFLSWEGNLFDRHFERYLGTPMHNCSRMPLLHVLRDSVAFEISFCIIYH